MSGATDAQPVGASVDRDELRKFAAMADEWWNPRGKFRPLHVLNPLRLGFIRDAVVSARGLDPAARQPLLGLRLLDIGCGGGLVCEPMARLGADVTGIDASDAGVAAARAHAAQSGLAIDYRVATAETLVAAGEAAFDAVLALEIVEHVTDPAAFLRTCARLVAPGGLLVVSTLNRTPKAFALAIVGAEYVLGWLPRGTHDWSKFLKPEEVAAPLREQGLAIEEPVGVVFDPIAGVWRLAGDTGVNYMLTARRAGE
jgi:2-polyprenyl-6-hydroxyphenyl methylase/3-demethylubiquinone-9 3-methyltransferase